MRSWLLVAAAAAVAGALMIVLATSQEWNALTITGPEHQHVSVTGRQVSPALPAIALALVALAVAIVAARGLLRRLVALVGVVVAAIEVAVAVLSRDDVGSALRARVFVVPAYLLHSLDEVPPRPWWWFLALAGGVVAAVAFGVVAIAGSKWQGMGARYDAPSATARPKDPAVAAWDALDRGDDPTEPA